MLVFRFRLVNTELATRSPPLSPPPFFSIPTLRNLFFSTHVIKPSQTEIRTPPYDLVLMASLGFLHHIQTNHCVVPLVIDQTNPY